ncbi:MAG: hypothetical protein E7321_05310 [Clostridiales bacterium]|nr:hypothetical protein [Clostridiales bacterium]
MRQVQEALAPIMLGVPVMAGIWRPTGGKQKQPDQYIVYSTMRTEHFHYDDALAEYKIFVYMNLWSDSDPTETAERVRNLMRKAGFALVSESDRGYNEPAYDYATRAFTVQWTWSYIEEATDWQSE